MKATSVGAVVTWHLEVRFTVTLKVGAIEPAWAAGIAAKAAARATATARRLFILFSVRFVGSGVALL